MDVMGFLRSLETLFYEIALGFITLPRTLLSAIARPVGLVRYLESERAKPDDAAFGDRMAPLAFWLIAAVLPATLVLVSAGPRSVDDSGLRFLVDKFLELSTEARFVVAGLTLMALPLGFAITFQTGLYKMPVARGPFRLAFETQCYLLTPVYLAIACAVVAASLVPEQWDVRPSAIIGWTCAAAFLWNAISEARVAADGFRRLAAAANVEMSGAVAAARGAGLYLASLMTTWLVLLVLDLVAVFYILLGGGAVKL